MKGCRNFFNTVEKSYDLLLSIAFTQKNNFIKLERGQQTVDITLDGSR